MEIPELVQVEIDKLGVQIYFTKGVSYSVYSIGGRVGNFIWLNEESDDKVFALAQGVAHLIINPQGSFKDDRIENDYRDIEVRKLARRILNGQSKN